MGIRIKTRTEMECRGEQDVTDVTKKNIDMKEKRMRRGQSMLGDMK